MNNLIKYYYNLNVENLEEYEKYYCFNSNGKKYLFKEYNNDLDTTKYIINVLYENKVKYNKIVLNKESNLLTKYNNKDYVLIYIDNNYIIDDLLIGIVVKNTNVKITDLWSKKIDQYIINLNELGLNQKALIDSFNYYVGLGECAISLYNDALNLDGEIINIISHKRMHYPNYSVNFLDPTNMIIDTKIRDISEYIKYKFFNNNFDLLEFDNIIKKYQINYKEMNLLYARLFYPTYYFDIFEDNIISNNESEFLKILYKKRILYEKFLYDIYLKYKNNYNLPFVKWLM